MTCAVCGRTGTRSEVFSAWGGPDEPTCDPCWRWGGLVLGRCRFLLRDRAYIFGGHWKALYAAAWRYAA